MYYRNAAQTESALGFSACPPPSETNPLPAAHPPLHLQTWQPPFGGSSERAHQGPRTSDTSRPTSPAPPRAQARPKPSPKSPNSTPRGSLLSCHHQIALPQARAPPHRRRCRRLGRSGRPTPSEGMSAAAPAVLHHRGTLPSLLPSALSCR